MYNLFKNTDYTFCMGKFCNKKETCVRYIEHYPHLMNSYLSMTLGSENCPLYIELKECEQC